MTSQRAARGGGTERSLAAPLNSNSFQSPAGYTVGVTYGTTGQGADWFGPGEPMAPQAPPEVAGRAFDFPQGVNILTATRPYSPITYETLRSFSDGYDLLRLIIETRKDAMARLRWNIQPRDSKVKVSPQVRNRISAITKFFRKPDGQNTWNAWLRMLLEDVLVVDAMTVHRRRTRGGKLIGLCQIDGATMRRVIDDWGHTPDDDTATAYQQIFKGMPAVNYTTKDIYYKPRNMRVHKLYGYSNVEQILMTINIGLRRQIFQLNFFTEGNMPPALIGVPETWTPDQIRTFQEWFDNILAGNLAEKRKARFVPSAVGKTYIPTQETELFGKAEEWLARVCCFAFGISPQPFLQMMNRSTSQTAAQEASATGLVPIQAFIKDFIDEILLEDFDGEDLEFVWRGDDELDPKKRQEIISGYLHDGLVTINEGRAESGREPYDDIMFDEPMFLTSNGLAPMLLTPQAQGAPKFDENGKELEKPVVQEDSQLYPQEGSSGGVSNADGNSSGDAVSNPKLNVGDKLKKLVEAGNPTALAAYLKEFVEGAKS